MVRHEAAEALAAIGAPRSRAILQEVMENTKSNFPEVAETCLLALNVMDWRLRGGHNNPEEKAPVGCACMLNPYSSVDPAPPHPAHANKTAEELGDILCDAENSIFDRYRAMFSLRNRGGEDSVLQLCRALISDNSSALLRHEVAYVLGQLQHTASVSALEESLRRKEEHQMVRHESAEALGAIDGSWEKVEAILEEFSKDGNQVVRESCLVALDAADYWGHNTNHGAENKGDEEKKEAPLSFVQLKGQPEDATKANQKVLNHHFNVKE
jgi:deoxyhypusine monooxygenase